MAVQNYPPGPGQDKELRVLLYQLINHSETVSWERFYHYLVVISLLGIAWATVYASNSDEHREVILACFGFTGAVLSVLWSGMGERSRRYRDMYDALLLRVEIGDDRAYRKLLYLLHNDNGAFLKNRDNKEIYSAIGCTGEILPSLDARLRAERLNKSFFQRISSSTVLLARVPAFLAMLFMLLAYCTFAPARAWWLFPVFSLALVVILVWPIETDPLAGNERP